MPIGHKTGCGKCVHLKSKEQGFLLTVSHVNRVRQPVAKHFLVHPASAIVRLVGDVGLVGEVGLVGDVGEVELLSPKQLPQQLQGLQTNSLRIDCNEVNDIH